MRRYLVLSAFLIAVVATSCDRSGTGVPPLGPSWRMSNFETGTIIVYVHWEEQGIPGKTVEILGTDRSAVTDANGIARFRVEAGACTIRVHGINRGGPALLYLDLKTSVDPHQRTVLDVVDCLPCV